MIRALSDVNLLNRLKRQRARLILPKRPKLFPNMRTVSKRPNLGVKLSIGVALARFKPLELATLIVKGEISVPNTSKPRF